MDDQKKTTNLEPSEATFVEQSGFHRGHLGRWSSLILLLALATNEFTLVIDPVSIPMQIMADAR